MSTFPRSPRLQKGAIIGIDIYNPVASVAVFQYNPETLTRRLETQGSQGSDRSEVHRLRGAPVETITLDVEIDATDQLETGDALTGSLGIYPQLAALEMLLYPKSALVIANTILLAAGTMEVIPPSGPFTLFVWGIKRVLPVKLTQFSVTEEQHDPNLNPIRAKVSLGLQVLTYDNFALTHPGYSLFLAHQVVKETMATLASLNNLAGVVSGDLQLL